MSPPRPAYRAEPADDGPPAAPVAALPPVAIVGGLVVGVAAVSTSAVLIRVAQAPSLALAFWRCGLGALALAPLAWRSRGHLARLDAGAWRQLVVSGGLLALHFALYISSLSFTTVASSAVLVAMSPLFVGIGAALYLDEPPTRRTWLGMALALAGAIVVGSADLSSEAFGGRALLGDALAFAGAAAVAGYLLIGRAARRRLPVVAYASTVYAVAAVILLMACLLTGASLGIGSGGYDAGTWAAIAGLVIGPQLLGHTVFNTLLSTLTATVVAIVVLAEPIGAGLLAYVFLAELPARAFWAGAPLILAGVWLATTRRRRA